MSLGNASERRAMLGTILRYYPTYSETFVYREIAELRRQGVPLVAITMRHHWIKALAAQSDLGGPLIEVPRIPLYLPILAGALRAFARAPKAWVEAIRWGMGHLRFKECLKALWMADRFRRAGVTHLHVHFAGEGAEVAEIIRRGAGIPYGITVHARDLFVPRPSVPDLFDGARYLVCISRFNRDWIASRYDRAVSSKAVVVRLGVPVGRFKVASRPRGDVFPILAVSRLVPKKGIETLVRAVAALRASRRQVTLTVAGEGPLRRSLQRLAGRLGIREHVRLEGACTQQEIEALYQQGVGAFVLPCEVADDGDRDGIPVALMEAMAREVPVVTTAVSGIPELVTHDVHGLVVPPRDVDALARAVARLIEEPDLCRRLGHAARARVDTHFTLEGSVTHLLRVIDNEDVSSWKQGERGSGTADRLEDPSGQAGRDR